MNEENSCLQEYSTNLAYYFSEALEKPFAKPYWTYISLSHKCTYSCQMCEVVKILKDFELSQETVKKVFSDIAQWQGEHNVVLTGGEVFLREDIFEIIKDGCDKKLTIEAVSNGALIDEAIASKIVSSGLKNIAISIDGAKSKTHDYVRQQGSFDKAVKAVSHLVEAKKKLGRGPQISVWTTIMKENLEELYDIVLLAENLGVECLVYHPVIVSQDDMQNTSLEAPFWIQKGKMGLLKKQIDKILSYQEDKGLVAFLHDPYLWIKYFEGALLKKDWKCNPFVFLNIGPDGEVRSCGNSFGNVIYEDLDSCLSTQAAFKARRQMRACPKPCLQTCWAYPEADVLEVIVNSFLEKVDQSNIDNNKKKAVLAEGSRILEQYERKAEQPDG